MPAAPRPPWLNQRGFRPMPTAPRPPWLNQRAQKKGTSGACRLVPFSACHMPTAKMMPNITTYSRMISDHITIQMIENTLPSV